MRPSIAVLPFPQPKRCTFLQWYKYTLFRHFIQLTNCKRFASRPPRKNSSNCLAVTSLVLGICAILSCLLLLIDSVGGFFCFNSIPLGAAGVALGIIARGEIRSRDPRGSTALATGGMVCSIIGLCIGVLLVLLSIATLAVLIRLLFSYI